MIRLLHGAGGGGSANTVTATTGGRSSYGEGGFRQQISGTLNAQRIQGTDATGNGCGGGGSFFGSAAADQTPLPGGSGSPGMVQIYGIKKTAVNVRPRFPKPLIAEFRSAGTFTWEIPDNINKVDMFMLGAGGNGGSIASVMFVAVSSGGGGGGYTNFIEDYDLSGKTAIPIVIGAGGQITAFDGLTVNPGGNGVSLTTGGTGGSGGSGSSGGGGTTIVGAAADLRGGSNGSNAGGSNAGIGQGFFGFRMTPNDPFTSHGAGGGGSFNNNVMGSTGGRSAYGTGGFRQQITGDIIEARVQGTDAAGNGCGGGGSFLAPGAANTSPLPGGRGSPGMIQIYGYKK